MKINYILFIFFIICTTSFQAPAMAVGEVICDQPGSASSMKVLGHTASQMSEVVCKAAADGRLQPSAESLIGQCSVGAKAALVAFGDGFVSMAKLAASLAADGASASASAIKSKVMSLWTKPETDASLAAEQAASANAAASESWLEKARSFYGASQILLNEFFHEAAFNAQLVGSSMVCLPLKFQIEYACQFLSQVALELVSVKAVATAADKTAEAAKAVNAFMKRTNMIGGMKDLSLSQRLAAAGNALEATQAYKLEEKFGEVGNLRSRIDPISGQQTLHFEETVVKDGKKVSVIRDVARDAKTLAIDSNFETGKKIAVLTVEKSKGKIMAFADVNNLGKVNYFKSGTQAGDEYLTRVGENIRKNLRPGDYFFKNGGDELVMVFQTEDAKVAKEIIQRIHTSIEKDSALQELFKAERTAAREKFRQTVQVDNVGGFGVPRALTTEQTQALRVLQESARVRPSLSIGATRIHGNWSEDLQRAEKQAGEVKLRYKKALGSDTSKYSSTFETIEESSPRFTAKPEILDPVE